MKILINIPQTTTEESLEVSSNNLKTANGKLNTAISKYEKIVSTLKRDQKEINSIFASTPNESVVQRVVDLIEKTPFDNVYSYVRTLMNNSYILLGYNIQNTHIPNDERYIKCVANDISAIEQDVLTLLFLVYESRDKNKILKNIDAQVITDITDFINGVVNGSKHELTDEMKLAMINSKADFYTDTYDISGLLPKTPYHTLYRIALDRSLIESLPKLEIMFAIYQLNSDDYV